MQEGHVPGTEVTLGPRIRTGAKELLALGRDKREDSVAKGTEILTNPFSSRRSRKK